MSIQDVNIQGFYAPLGLKCYICTHIQVLKIQGSEVIYRYKDEYRAHHMYLDELLDTFELIKW